MGITQNVVGNIAHKSSLHHVVDSRGHDWHKVDERFGITETLARAHAKFLSKTHGGVVKHFTESHERGHFSFWKKVLNKYTVGRANIPSKYEGERRVVPNYTVGRTNVIGKYTRR